MKKKILLAFGITAASVAVAGGAMALWTANGSGPGNAQARTAIPLTVNAVTGTADLYPGFTGGKVHFTLTNTNPYPVTFTNMTPGTIVSSSPGTCAASNVSAVGKTGLALNVGANTTSAALEIDAVVTMASSALDACQGVTFTIPLTLTGGQV